MAPSSFVCNQVKRFSSVGRAREPSAKPLALHLGLPWIQRVRWLEHSLSQPVRRLSKQLIIAGIVREDLLCNVTGGCTHQNRPVFLELQYAVCWCRHINALPNVAAPAAGIATIVGTIVVQGMYITFCVPI
jgi:hypothetical protein